MSKSDFANNYKFVDRLSKSMINEIWTQVQDLFTEIEFLLKSLNDKVIDLKTFLNS